MDLLYFVLLVSTLIFIHESGHFVFAKIFGVKVLTFSLGFGPKILQIRGRETTYCISLFPFGGFVKMLEEDKEADPILPEDRGRTFESQALWKRILIVIAGPTMNVLFPMVLYTSVYLEDRFFLPPTVGAVQPGKPAEGKLLPGDVILEAAGTAVSTFPEVQRIVSEHAGTEVVLQVRREGKVIEVTVTPADEVEIVEPRELELTEHVGRLGIQPSFFASVVGIARPDSPAARAGLATFDRITAVNGKRIDRFVDLAQVLADNHGETMLITYLRPLSLPQALGGLGDLAVLEPGAVTLALGPRTGDSAPTDERQREADVLSRTGIETADLYAASVPEGSSEWLAGLRAGDRILTLDGVSERSWRSFDEELESGADRLHTLSWTRGGEPMSGSFKLRQERWNDDLGQHYEEYVFRTTHWLPTDTDPRVKNPNLFLYAARHGVEETASVVKYIVVGFARLLEGRISLATVSGPITMYDIAGEAGAKGTTYFLWAMALISLNLGIINLLPIPVLDGGTLFFLVIEALRRRPVTLRTREIASLVGMVVLVLLMLLAFKNDVERRWDVILGEIREIFG